MRAIWAIVSTFWISVGRPPTPRSNGRGGVAVGFAGPPFSQWTSALSSPATNRSGVPATDRRTGRARGRAPPHGLADPRDRRAGGARHGDDHLVRADGAGRGQGAVDHQVGVARQQDGVLAAGRLALGAVGHDHLAPAALGDRGELQRGGEARPAAAAQAAALDLVDQRGAVEPRRAARLARAEQAGQAAGADGGQGREGAGGHQRAVTGDGSSGGRRRRHAMLPPIRATQPMATARSHRVEVSVPMPSAWKKATGQVA